MSHKLLQLKREVEIVRRALNLEPNPNYRFATWGEFNCTYLMFLSPIELEQYRHLTTKFAVIHEHYKRGKVPSIHDDANSFMAVVNATVNELERSE